MNFLKKQHRVILFFVALIAALEIGNTFRIARIVEAVENFEPVVIEYVEPKTTPVPEKTPEIIPEPEVVPEPEVIPEPISPRIDCPLDDETQQMIYDRCEELDLDFALVMGLIFTESSFRPDVVSQSHDYGLMQINRTNHNWLSKELGITDFLDPEQNVKAGTHILRYLFDRYNNLNFILMSYNLGEGGAIDLWNQGIRSTGYADKVIQQANIYQKQIDERMGENDSM